MAEYIEREALKRLLIDKYNFFPVFVKNAIEESPTADVVEVRHGIWTEKVKDERFGDEWDEIVLYECSVCNSECVESLGIYKYCANCGAKMDGGNEDGYDLYYKKAFEIAVRCARELNGTPELKEAYQEAQKDNRALQSFMDFCLKKATEEAQK